jgi:hypothetical protein
MQVGIDLGSRAQWSTMQHTAELLANLGVAYEARIITANKNANRLHEYASKAVCIPPSVLVLSHSYIILFRTFTQAGICSLVNFTSSSSTGLPTT